MTDQPTDRELIAAACRHYADQLGDMLGDLTAPGLREICDRLEALADKAEHPPTARPQARPRPPFPVRPAPVCDDEPPF